MTEKSVRVIEPVYEETTVILRLTCALKNVGYYDLSAPEIPGATEFEDVEEWGVHAEEHMDNGEEARSTVRTKRVFLRMEEAVYPEKGYWKTIYVYE